MSAPPDEQVKAGIIARDAILLGKKLIKSEVEKNEFISLEKIDSEIESFVRDNGATPALKGYKPPFSNDTYQHATCICIDNDVTHGVPSRHKVAVCDSIVTIDLVVNFSGWHADTARSFIAYHDSSCLKNHFVTTCESIFELIRCRVKPGMTLFDFTKSCMTTKAYMNKNLSLCYEYCGHGIGKIIHDRPNISFTYPSNRTQQVEVAHRDINVCFESGKAYAIEPIFFNGPKYELYDDQDGWTVKSNRLACHFEDTIHVGDQGIYNITS